MNQQELTLQMKTACFHNAYGGDAVRAFCGGGNLVAEKGSTAALCDEGGFIRVYWAVQQEEDFTPLYEKAAQKANGKPFISEIVYRMDQPSAAQRLIRAGMEEYSRLVYMTRTPDRVSNTGGGYCSHAIDSPCNEKAVIEDIDTIYQHLWDMFDPLVSHLPSRTQLKRYIQNGEAAVVRVGQKIGAFALFQELGAQATYIYQLATVPDERGKGLAGTLLHNELRQFGRQRAFSLWVEERNRAAAALYTKYGFAPAGRRLTILKGA